MRNNGGPPLSQIGMALEELADLIEAAVPHMRDTAEQLRAGLSEDNVSLIVHYRNNHSFLVYTARYKQKGTLYFKSHTRYELNKSFYGIHSRKHGN